MICFTINVIKPWHVFFGRIKTKYFQFAGCIFQRVVCQKTQIVSYMYRDPRGNSIQKDKNILVFLLIYIKI